MAHRDVPGKHAVRHWLMARQKSRLPLPEREVMLRELSILSMEAKDASRNHLEGSDLKDAELVQTAQHSD
ncbi:MAG: hypothetical protein V4857_08075 [Pseudomonadota bacterium]